MTAAATPPAAPEPPATILVVEDRAEVLDVLHRTLTGRGYTVHTATDGETAVTEAMRLQPDLMILDVGLPRRNGFDVAREVRSRGFQSPVLMLTAYISVSDKVMGLDAGADDYLAKPFDYDELLARVKALLRRSQMAQPAAVLRVGDVTLDPLSREVTRAGQPLALTQKEYALLEYFVRHAGQALTREEISEQVWKAPFDTKTNIVDVYVNYLRKKLDVAGSPPMLHTVRGTGYTLRPAGPPQASAS